MANEKTAPASQAAPVSDSKWYEGFDIAEIAAKREKHDAFVVTKTVKQEKDATGKMVPVTKYAIKNRFTHVTGRFAAGNIPEAMKWTDEQVEIVNNECERRAQDAVREAVEARNKGTFSREVYLARPRLSDEARKARTAEQAKRHEAFLKRKAASKAAREAREKKSAENKKLRAEKKEKRNAEIAAAKKAKSEKLAAEAAKLTKKA